MGTERLDRLRGIADIHGAVVEGDARTGVRKGNLPLTHEAGERDVPRPAEVIDAESVGELGAHREPVSIERIVVV